MSETLAIPPHLQKYLLAGDWKQAPDEHKNEFTNLVCEHAGLTPLTRPIQWLTLNGKLQPYAAKDCTDQLRKVNDISLSINAREFHGETYIVTCQAMARGGRYDESTGAVSLEGLTGEAKSNALMKAETKAKRRVTLSLCGLGILDESEIESIPGATVEPAAARITQDNRDAAKAIEKTVPTKLDPDIRVSQEQLDALKGEQKPPAGKPAKPATIHHSVSNSLASDPSLHTVEGNCAKKGQKLEEIEAEDPTWFEKALRPANRKKLTELDVLMIDDFLRLRAAGHEPFAKDSIPF